jgi:hypothetical protein
VLEAGFLILLAVVVGLADLSPALIVLVMTVGWLLVALIEYFAWRQTVAFPALRRYESVEAPPAARVEEQVVEDVAPPPPPSPPPTPPPPTTAPAEEETIVTPPRPEQPPAELEEATDFHPERLILHRLEPLQPRPRRRWIIFGPYERREGDREEER